MLFENLLSAAILMEVLDAVLAGQISEGEWKLIIETCPLKLPEA